MAKRRPKKYRRKDYSYSGRQRPNGKGLLKKTDIKRACPSGKRGYATKGDALAGADRRRDAVNVYECPDCGEYHLADKTPRRIRQAKARGEL